MPQLHSTGDAVSGHFPSHTPVKRSCRGSHASEDLSFFQMPLCLQPLSHRDRDTLYRLYGNYIHTFRHRCRQLPESVLLRFLHPPACQTYIPVSSFPLCKVKAHIPFPWEHAMQSLLFSLRLPCQRAVVFLLSSSYSVPFSLPAVCSIHVYIILIDKERLNVSLRFIDTVFQNRSRRLYGCLPHIDR